MTSFLEKLKRGMGIEDSLQKKPAPEKEKPKKVVKKAEAKPIKEKPKKEIKKKKIEIREEIKETPPAKIVETKKQKWFEPEGKLAIDVYQTNGEIVIQSAIAGIKPEDLDITIEKDIIIIKGTREKTSEVRQRNYFYQECYWGRFSREIILPAEVNSGKAEATMKEGILTMRIPKIEREKRKKIVIKE